MIKKLKMTKAEILLQLKNIALIIVGTLVLAFGCAIFVVPFNLVTGGVTGLSIVIENIFIEIGLKIEIDIIIGVLTWLMFFLGLICLGKDFALKTLVSAIVYPPAISLFMRLADPNVMGGFLDLTTSAHADIALIISALFGGLCIGTGCAITFLGGGSTGGIDIIAFILCRIFKKWKSSVVIFAIDAATILLGMFVLQDLILTLLGIISASVGAIVIDKIFLGRSQAFTAQIVSDKYEEINLAIRNEVRRTTTMIPAKGGYSGDSKTVVMVTVTMRQYAYLMNAIKRIDDTAFVSISRAHEINGEGFTYGTHD